MPPDLIVKVGATALGMLALFLLVMTVSQLKEFRYIGSGVTATNTISVSGMGEVFAIPDTATFTVSVHEEAETVTFAQEEAAKKINAIKAYLLEAGVEEKDIKTVSYNVNPKYEWETVACREGYCPGGKQTLIGFEVYQSYSVKVKDTKKAGELLSGVGGKGASDVSGLSFTIEDEDTLKAEARKQAIQEAQVKADALASQLGVKIARVVGFYEDSGGYPPPYAYGMGGDAAMSRVESAKVAPELPVGENKIVSNVNVTYEIR
ncbi:MAG: hypothetical protein G01um10148_156 [Parcubacteria group bacterium Gr01-1014_8]|nr:MAG: hypothetical protein G01um10148_156 [Parcubacteria group bacterium Gr01-1014_8]